MQNCSIECNHFQSVCFNTVPKPVTPLRWPKSALHCSTVAIAFSRMKGTTAIINTEHGIAIMNGSKSFMDDVEVVVYRALDNEPSVSEIVIEQRRPAHTAEIDAWERDHAPFKLPNDLKNFYGVSDGFKLTWKAVIGSETPPVPMGLMYGEFLTPN